MRLLKQLRAACPGLLPPAPLAAGTVGPEIVVDAKALRGLAQTAVRRSGSAAVLWVDGDDELRLDVADLRLETADGVVRVRLPVRCEQVKRALVEVLFVVGDVKRPAGLLAATEARPRGPDVVVDRWGDALTALAWQVLLRVVSGVAAASGTDEDGAGLIPAAMSATPNGLRVLTMARHPFDRIKT